MSKIVSRNAARRISIFLRINSRRDVSSIRKILNKFNRSHAGLRKFLCLLSYGCYHRNLFMRHNITPRTYDDLLRQVRLFVPEKNLQTTRHDKCTYFTLIGDFRHGTENLTFPEIMTRVEKILEERRPNFLDADLPQTLRRRLNELIGTSRCSARRDFFVRQPEKPVPLARICATNFSIQEQQLRAGLGRRHLADDNRGGTSAQKNFRRTRK